MSDVQAVVHAFLLDFVEGRDRSRDAAARVEPLVDDLASADARFEELAVALASYDGRQGQAERGMFNQDALAFECRQALHDFDDHRHCAHEG